MNKLKAVVLLVALLLPVSIFLFLKYFGKNEFQVEPLYETELPDWASSECAISHILPYQVPDSILLGIGWNKSYRLTLFSFYAGASPAYERIMTNYPEQDVRLINVVVRDQDFTPVRGLWTMPVDGELLAEWKKCFLFMSEPNDLILVDDEGRIRGYYQLDNREEIDRLLMELSIMLNRY
ncbi:MAG: hypothetical protein MUE95_05320 [Cyclobacteriaceae bacterium]|jgi:hypothetical protein|nr:hypothetical protein [Cyclobacteriaceae bacterium]